MFFVIIAQQPEQFECSNEWIEKIWELAPAKTDIQTKKNQKILVFNLITGFDHWVTPHTAQVIKVLGKKTGAYNMVMSTDIFEFEKKKLKQFDAVVNIQGDEPLISEVLISDIYNTLSCGEHDVVTAVSFNISHEDYLSKDIVKVVLNHDFQAMYFSRSPIPFISKENFNGFYQHIGIYGYLKSAIEKFVQYQQADLELAENLEQLRFLANGIIIKAVVSDYQSVGVDIPEDIKKVENIIRTKNEKD